MQMEELKHSIEIDHLTGLLDAHFDSKCDNSIDIKQSHKKIYKSYG